VVLLLPPLCFIRQTGCLSELQGVTSSVDIRFADLVTNSSSFLLQICAALGESLMDELKCEIVCVYIYDTGLSLIIDHHFGVYFVMLSDKWINNIFFV